MRNKIAMKKFFIMFIIIRFNHINHGTYMIMNKIIEWSLMPYDVINSLINIISYSAPFYNQYRMVTSAI